ncbi:hypothetical protein Tco_1427014, partial [Tanacetum coccineum]
NLATKRSLIQTHSSHASGSSADEGTGSIPGVPDVPTYESDDKQISWKSSKEDDDDEVNVSEDDDDDNDDNIDKDDEDDDADNQDDENLDDANPDDDDEQTESDNDGDDFVHPKISTHNDEARQDGVVNEEKEKEIDEEATHEEDEANELYRDVNVNLEGRDTEMTDAPLPNVQGTQVTEDTHVIITALVNPEGIDTIFTLNNEATSLVDVPVTTIAEPPLLSATTLPPPPTPLITHLQQHQYLHQQLFQASHYKIFPTLALYSAFSFIPGIVDAYLANKMHEAVKTADQLQSERLRDEA